MNDKDLTNFLPKIGDRVSLKIFIEEIKDKKRKPKSTILRALRQKMGIQGKDSQSSSSSDEGPSTSKPKKPTGPQMARMGNRSANKNLRKVEVGWIHKGKQIRTPRGGGTRKLNLPKFYKKEQILDEITPLFFPHGQSPMGPTEHFDFSVADFSQRDIEDQSINDLYVSSKMTTLHLYLITSQKQKDRDESATYDPVSSSDELPDLFVPVEMEKEVKPKIPEVSFTPGQVVFQDDTVSEGNLAAATVASIMSRDNEHSGEIVAFENVAAGSILLDIQNYMYDPEIVFGPSQLSSNPEETLPVRACVKNLVIKRGNAFSDIMKYFLKEEFNLLTDTLELSILTERGEDSGGVFRDAMSEYWETFYLKHTEGADVKIPTTVHIMKQEEWEAVAKTLVLCFKQEKYLPIQLSQIFLKKCIFDITPTNEELLESFLGFLPDMDRGLIRDALDDFDSVDENELLDALSNFNPRVYPTKENLNKLVIELAHHELIQKPSFVALCWFPILSQHLKPMVGKLEDVYEESKVTNKKVLNLFVFPDDMTKAEKETCDALKRYVKTCSTEKLKMLLRFCTGSDIIIGKKITLRITPPMTDFSLCPVAHTCGCVLELSRSYDNFLLLREHLENVLDTKVLRMDIV